MAGYSEVYRTIPQWVQDELNRRSEREYIQETRSAWVRCTSGFKTDEGERKILMGGDISNENSLQFGFSGLYEAADAVPPKRPAPGITSIDITESKRTAEGTIDWKAWSLDQLEDLQPFFMNPATTMFIEIGWSDMDPSVTVDPLASEDTIAKFYKGLDEGNDKESSVRNYKDHPRFAKMRNGDGMYFVFPAKISDFSFEMNQQGGFDCSTSVIALAESMYKLSIANNTYPRVHAPNDKNPKSILERIRDDLTFENPEASEPQNIGAVGPGPTVSSSSSNVQQEYAGDSSDTPIIHGGDTYPSSTPLGPNHYYTWGQIETVFNKGFQLANDGNLQSLDSAWRLNSMDTQVSYFRDEVGIKSRDLDVCVVNAGKQKNNLPPKFDKNTNAVGNTLEQKNGRAGWLYHLAVSTKTFKRAVQINDKYFEALLHMLEKCSEACYGIWDFELTVERETGTMQVIDRNHLYSKTTDKIKNDEKNLYNFKVYSQSSQIRDFSLSSDLGDKFISVFAAKNLDVSNSKKPIFNARSDVEGQFFQRFKGTDQVWKGLRQIKEKNNKEISSVFEEEAKERNEKRLGLANPFYAPLNVPKQTERTELREKREEQRSEWDDAKFDSIFPEAWEILEIKRDINKDEDEGSAINANAPINVNVSLTLNGIAGLRRYQVFKVAHVPEFYKVNGFFILESVRHSVQNNDWVTSIEGRFIVSNMFKKNNQESGNQ